MKSILSGFAPAAGLLTVQCGPPPTRWPGPAPLLTADRALVVKLLGLILGLGGGALLGMEGPMVHLACIVFAQFARLPFFSRIRQVSRHPLLQWL